MPKVQVQRERELNLPTIKNPNFPPSSDETGRRLQVILLPLTIATTIALALLAYLFNFFMAQNAQLESFPSQQIEVTTPASAETSSP